MTEIDDILIGVITTLINHELGHLCDDKFIGMYSPTIHSHMFTKEENEFLIDLLKDAVKVSDDVGSDWHTFEIQFTT